MRISPPNTAARKQSELENDNNNDTLPTHYNDNQTQLPATTPKISLPSSLTAGHNLSRSVHPQLDQIVAAFAARNAEHKVQYYSPADVAQHARLDGLWLSALGVVYDLTPFLRKTDGFVAEHYWAPLFEFAGRDVSHWFDATTGDLRVRRDPITNLLISLCPDGQFVGANVATPTTAFDMDVWQPWWRARELMIGLLTAKPREILVYNMLTTQERKVQVCHEDSVGNIADRVRDWNAHIESYTWKYLGKNLDMNENLEQNGIVDEENTFYDLGLNGEHWMPRLMLYFNDDLTQK